MPSEYPAPARERKVPACLGYGPWLASVAGEHHRHVCMQDRDHDGPCRCVWHPQDRFEPVGYLPPELIP